MLPALVAAGCLGGGAAAFAQGQATPVAAASGASVPRAARASSPVEVRVFEDDRVRIEETRVRGQLQRIVVRPKDSTLAPYEINVGAGGRDPTQDRSSAGQRVWSVLRF
ncbi:MAG: hypothetical protein KIT17_22175 [Rubrivivax sp.]|nr:hypothetical protein [Rubrivivax sp.]